MRRCVHQVVDDTFMLRYHRCQNNALPGKDKCGIHSPEAVARRRAKADAAWNARAARARAPFDQAQHFRAVLNVAVKALERVRPHISGTAPLEDVNFTLKKIEEMLK